MSDWYEEMERAEQEYDAKLEDEARAYQDGYQQGRADATAEIKENMDVLWNAYVNNPDNVPKPDLMSVYALIAVMEE